MVATQINNQQYLLEGNDEIDFVNVRAGSQFLESDKRTIKNIEARPHPSFAFCYVVTMNDI